MSTLTSTERRAMRAAAHHLQPVVAVGQHGLTPAVQHEIDIALRAHELVKIRVHNDSRVERQALLAALCAALDCAPVQHLGKLLVVWRANPDKAKRAPAHGASDKPRRAGAGKSKPDADARPRDAAGERRRRRNSLGGKAGNTMLPYFSRRGAGRFVAGTPDMPPRDAGTPSTRTPSHGSSRSAQSKREGDEAPRAPRGAADTKKRGAGRRPASVGARSPTSGTSLRRRRG